MINLKINPKLIIVKLNGIYKAYIKSEDGME